ncbi:MAG: hypothetical protein MMC33_000669 [Icmadophila ericetorum]|nr:hypothetical protein [Icmadophila ericetorum]
MKKTATKPPVSLKDELASPSSMTAIPGEKPKAPQTTASLEELQSDEQRKVLDIVAQLRKCGLESLLPLPQLVVCGDQSAGKSSVLEALTEIPFPRADNLCTRYATEIILRLAPRDSITIKVIPDPDRPANEKETISAFRESISDFGELSFLMDKATKVMGIQSKSDSKTKAFAKDVLSIEIEGPNRPQLTLVDLPGLIRSQTKGVTKEDISLVTEITDHYIRQRRTICLAVVAATNDYANQGILDKVRDFDPTGERTLGIITKPDRLPAGSGSEKAYLDLAQNKDIFFKLGWHLLKNRAYEDGSSSFDERNASEDTFFRRSNFAALQKDCVGIASLRSRLSQLLFNHVRQELPMLQVDLEKALDDSQGQLGIMGTSRASARECRSYLMELSIEISATCKAAVNGHYEGNYFIRDVDPIFSTESQASIRRLRAVVQDTNSGFSELVRKTGHKYHINQPEGADGEKEKVEEASKSLEDSSPWATKSLSKPIPAPPIKLSMSQAIEWVGEVLARTRGKELEGNYNPLLIGELFWEQSEKWQTIATGHVENVTMLCTNFLDALVKEKSPKDVQSRLLPQVQDALKMRHEDAIKELSKIIEDAKNFPINYNHYYTDTIKRMRLERETKSLANSINSASRTDSHKQLTAEGKMEHFSAQVVDVDKAIKAYSKQTDTNMREHSCIEALDSLLSIYKLQQKTFIANITTQVCERHIVRGLEKIFSPLVVNDMSDAEAEAIAAEPPAAKRQRRFLEDRLGKLKDGHRILKGFMRGKIVEETVSAQKGKET